MSSDVNYGLTDLEVVDILFAWSCYQLHEFGERPITTSIHDVADKDGVIHIAYTDYDCDYPVYEDETGSYEYHSIQVDYNLYKRTYVHYLTLVNGSEKIVTQQASIEQLVNDLRYCNFDDFVSI